MGIFGFLPDPEVYLHMLERGKNIPYENVLGCLNYFNNYRQIFTDGSKDPESGKTGLGVYVASSRSRQSVRTSDHLSVFSVELLAILWALDWVEENKPPKSIICSDSAAALVALKEGTSRARPDLIWEILTCLFRIERSGFNVCFSVDTWPFRSGGKQNL